MRRLKAIAATLALLGASLVFALGVAEACLRLFPQLLPEEAQLRLHWRGMGETVAQGDPYLGHVFPPNYVGRVGRASDDSAFTYTTDEHGFRNHSPWPERADIVVLGDSMAFGYGVGDDETWTALLAEGLPGQRIINLALIGGAPQQYLRIYERFGQALQPALVLFCLFPANDVKDAGLFDRWVQAGSQGNYLIRRFANDNEHLELSIRGLLGRSYLVAFLRYARDRSLVQGETITFPDSGQIQLVPALYEELERQATPEHPNFRMTLDAVEQTLALAARNGAEFLVLLVPSKEEVYLPLLDEEPPPATAPFVAQFDEMGIPYLDLTPGLRAGARQGERLFFEVDGHPNAAGYRLMADLVLDYLRKNPQRYRLAEMD